MIAAIADAGAEERKANAERLREHADMVESGAIGDYVIVADCVRDRVFMATASFKDRWRILGAIEYAKAHIFKEMQE